MKRILLILLCAIFSSLTLKAATGWFADYIKINPNNTSSGYYWIGANPSFGTALQGHDFGNVSSLQITGCDVKYWSDTQDRTGGAFYYEIKGADNLSTIVTATEVVWDHASIGGNDYQGLKTVSINLLNTLVPNTTYKLHVWAKSWGTGQGDSYLSNDGVNYVATFTYVTTTFTGTGDWNSATNWSAGVPNASLNAVISGNATISSDVTVKDLTISTGSSLTVNPAKSLTVSGTLVNNAGTTGLVINSGASLIESSAGVEATIKRDISSGTDSWHLLCLPLVGNIATASPFFDGAYLDKYLESSGAWQRLTNSDPVLPKTGYSINYATGVSNLEFKGTLQSGDQAFSGLTYTAGAGGYGAGWHLLGNPFPSAVNVSQGTWTKTNLDSYIYVWNGSQYVCGPTAPSGLGTLPGNIVPAMQGFFVKATAGNASLIIPGASQVNSTTSFYKSTKSTANALTLSITGNGYGDKSIIAVNPSATTGFDSDFDAYKLYGITDAPQIYSIIPGNNLAVNSMSFIESSEHVALGLKVGVETTYVLTVEGIDSFDPSLFFRLEDLELGTSQDMRVNPVYSFTAAPGDAENRFRLSFASATAVTDQKSEGINVFYKNGTIRINLDLPVKGTAYLYSVSGKLLDASTLHAGETILKPSSAGIYLVKVVTDKNSSTRKIAVVN